ncbi:MAG: MFS transporter [Clostridia bacterium]|nr:MFS transporter [Clostridia bacterium]
MTTAQEPEIIRGRFAALGYRDFRLVFLTAALSNTGNWMEIVLRNWLVYEISGSAFALGLCNLAHWLPFLILSPLAGAYVDRWDKRWVILSAQVTLTLVTLTLGLLTITGRIGIWQVVVLVLIHGVAESFDNPARQSLVSDLVGRKVVINAVSLNSAMYYGTRLVGPAIGGLLIAVSGTGIGFIINAATFLPYIFVLPFIHPRSASQGRVEQKAWKALLEGLAACVNNTGPNSA